MLDFTSTRAISGCVIKLFAIALDGAQGRQPAALEAVLLTASRLLPEGS